MSSLARTNPSKTAKEIMQEFGKKENKGRRKRPEEEESVSNMVSPENIVVFVPPKGSDVTPSQMAEALIKKGVCRPMKAILVPHTGKGFAWTQPNIFYGPDKFMYKNVRSIPFIGDLIGVRASGLVRSNGTRRAVLNRMVTQMTLPKTADYRMMTGIENVLKFSTKEYVYEEFLDPESQCLQELNPKADAGLPYLFLHDKNVAPKVGGGTLLPLEYHKDKHLLDEEVSILEHGLYWANKFLSGLKECEKRGEAITYLKEFLIQYPEMNTFVLKRKDEALPTDDWNKKVRPYGCQPLMFRLLCKMLIHSISSRMLSFWEDSDSCSAYRLSVFHGGGEKIINWIVGCLSKKSDRTEFYAISYGDDQLWLIVYPDGSFHIYAPDVRAMDMSTLSAAGFRFSAYINMVFKMPKLYDHLLTISSYISYHHYMHLGGGVVVEKMNSLFSGIPGTTERNIFSSAEIHALIKDYMRVHVVTKENVSEHLQVILEMIKVKFNFEFKDFNVNVPFEELPGQYCANLNQLLEDGVSLPFLQCCVRVVDHNGERRYVMVTQDAIKLGASLVIHGSRNLTDKVRAERLAGIYFAGGWFYPLLAQKIHEMYNVLIAKEKEAEFSISCEHSLMEDGVQSYLVYAKEMGITPKDGLPSYDTMMDFATMDPEAFAEKYMRNPTKMQKFVVEANEGELVGEDGQAGLAFTDDELVEMYSRDGINISNDNVTTFASSLEPPMPKYGKSQQSQLMGKTNAEKDLKYKKWQQKVKERKEARERLLHERFARRELRQSKEEEIYSNEDYVEAANDLEETPAEDDIEDMAERFMEEYEDSEDFRRLKKDRSDDEFLDLLMERAKNGDKTARNYLGLMGFFNDRE